MDSLIDLLDEVIEETKIFVSSVKPSEWYEQNMIMPRGSAFPGPFSFNLTPYWKEPLDCGHKDHPCKEISIMKGAQLGGTAAVLNPIVGYTIAQNPGNIMFLTGHSDLSDAAVQKIDHMIDSCSIRKLIRPSVLRARNSRTGDTNKSKEFPGGNLKSGSVTNHNLLRQHDVMIMIVDDYDASPQFSKDAGSTRELVQKRTSAFAHKKKIYWVSSPQLKGLSNIEEVFLLGDQRYYHVPCPCCGEFIVLKWSIENTETGDMAGITWKVDAHNNLIKDSVGYICQKCGGFFDSTNKYEMNINGMWIPTEANPKEKYHQSYQISSLYAPPGMDDWDYYVTQYLNANPLGSAREEKKHQTFMNVVLGETYEYQGEEIKASELQKNICAYEIGTIPEKLSIEHGNGRIVLITCAADLNGLEDDARLDYEIVAWSENMSSYSIKHGSIGTFIPMEGSKKRDREKWSYKHGVSNSVWIAFSEVIKEIFVTDTGRSMKVFVSGIDCGYQTQLAYQYIDNCNLNVIGLKGKDEDKYTAIDKDTKTYRHAREKTNLYLVEANIVKDELARYLTLKYDSRYHDSQPNCFVNFPTPSGGLYLFENYFAHFEAEHKILDKDSRFRWKKKSIVHQNHLFDCFDEYTEVLTSNGWKYFSNLSNTEELATVNLENDFLEFQKPIALIKKEYKGDLIKIKGRRLDILVTPSHRMVVYRKKWNSDTNSGKMQENPEIVLAKDLRATDTIKLSCKWNEKGDKTYTIPACYSSLGVLISEKVDIDSELWAEFLGIYVSEGSSWSGKNKKGSVLRRVMVHQNKGDNFDKIKSIFDRLPFTYQVTKSRGNNFVFIITSKQLFTEIERMGIGKNCYTKRSGEWIKKQNAKVISSFLNFAIIGDGHETKNGYRTYYTTSKLLSDDVQELFLKINKQPNINYIEPKECKLTPGVVGNTVVQYHVSENKTIKGSLRDSNNKSIITNIEYDGYVYCATVPNGTLVCRRNGKLFIAGNCRLYNMVCKDILVDMVCKELGIKNPSFSDYVDAVLPK